MSAHTISPILSNLDKIAEIWPNEAEAATLRSISKRFVEIEAEFVDELGKTRHAIREAAELLRAGAPSNALRVLEDALHPAHGSNGPG